MATKEIWVSPNGSNSGAGTKASPYKTIQQAINNADPGTVIKVKAGTYRETIEINRGVNGDLKNLTDAKDLKIVSVDGKGAAVIDGSKANDSDSTVTMNEMSHVTIDGFHIVSNPRSTKDGGGIKVIGNPSGAKGNPSKDIEITDNTFSGKGVSMIKISMTRDVEIEGNSFRGNASLNFIDMVTVWDSKIAGNDFTGTARVGITMKAGSQDNLVQKNFFDFATGGGGEGQAAVLVGGVGHSRLGRDPLPSNFDGFEAKDILVVQNVILSHTDAGVMFQGGINSVVRDNLLGATGGTATKSAFAPSKNNESNSGNNKIIDNILLDVNKVHGVVEGQGKGTIVANNKPGSLKDVDFSYGAGSTGGNSSTPKAPGSVTEEQPKVAEPAPSKAPEPVKAPEPAKQVADPTPSKSSDDGDVVLTLKMGGTGTDLFPPKFNVIVDGKVIATETIDNPLEATGSSSYVRFDTQNESLYDTYSYKLSKGAPDKIKIAFVNDGTDQGTNRDIGFDWAEIQGVRLETEKHAEFSAKNGDKRFEGAVEKAFVNGEWEFSDVLDFL